MIRNGYVRALTLAAGLSAVGTPALALQTCFTAFGGTVHYQFAARLSDFKTAGTHAIPGVVFGALSACAGLSFWGVVGTATSDGTTTVLGLRDETADATGCGAVDLTVSLSPTTLSGPLQLYNERTNFGNTSTMMKAPCVAPPAAAARITGRDAMGNGR